MYYIYICYVFNKIKYWQYILNFILREIFLGVFLPFKTQIRVRRNGGRFSIKIKNHAVSIATSLRCREL